MITAKESDIKRRKQEMLDSLPPYYQESPEANAIMRGNASEIERKRAEAQDLLDQMFVSTATWGLDYWDRVLDLAPAPRMEIEQRRSRIISKLRGTATATKNNLESVVDAYLSIGQSEIVEDNENYSFSVVINANNEIRDGLRRGIEEVKPAHLLAIYELYADVGNLLVKNDSYDYPVYYKTCGEFSGEKEFTQMEVGAINAADDTYDYTVEYPESVKEFTQVDLSPITAADDSYSYIKRFAVTGEMETLTKGHNTLHGASSAAGDLYDYQATYPVCGEFYAEGDG